MQQKIVFTSGMDSDTSAEKFGEGKAAKRVDVRVLASDNNEIGAIETVLGNSVVSYALPAGDNVVIGSKEDPKGNKIYYFLWNSNNAHQILEYNYASSIITLVLKEATVAPYYLNFSLGHLITGINIVELDSDTKLLYWTDDYVDPNDPDVYNEPKKLNIEKAKLHSAGDFVNGYTSPFEPRFITRIKQPPLNAPTYQWSSVNNDPVLQDVFYATYLDFPSEITLECPYVEAPLIFNVDAGSPGDGYDTSTFIWTVAASGYYRVTSSISALINGNSPGMEYSIISNISGVIYTQTFNTLPFPNTASIELTIIYLSAGEQISISILNNTPQTYDPYGQPEIFDYVEPIFFRAEKYLTINDIPLANLLNKKFFRFKTQFGYDDRELSAWSPISKYEYPKTKATGETAESVMYLDNKITISVPTGSSIVTRIRIAVKQFGSTEFSLIADLSKKLLNIPNDSTYDFEFLNEGNYVQLETTESNRLFDWVPQRSKAQEFISGNRIVDGNITENFDPVNIDMRLPISYVPLTPPANIWFPNASYFKSGGSYKTGIVYYDYFGNRSGLANTVNGRSSKYIGDVFGTTLFVPFLTDPLYNAPHGSPNLDMTYVPKVNIEIYNNPPKWATHYQIVRSKNESIGRYIQFAVQKISYLDLNGNIVAPSSATLINVSIINITDRYKSENPASQLVYDYAVGDRCRFIANKYGSGTAFTQIEAFFNYNDTSINGYDAGSGTFSVTIDEFTPLNVSEGALIEIYQPAQTVVNDNELMYEIAEEGTLGKDIHGNLVHNGSIANQLISPCTSTSYSAMTNIMVVAAPVGHGFNINDKIKVKANSGAFSIYGIVTGTTGTSITIDTTGYTMFGTYASSVACKIVKAAEDVFTTGDSFRKYCNMPWVNSASIVNRLYSYIETASANNMFTSNLDQTGRPNRIDREITRVTRPSTIYWSEFLVPETNINGLSTVYDQSFDSYEQRYGGIQKLFNENMGLVMLQELKCAMIPVQRILYGDLSLQNTVGASTSVLSPQAVYYDGEFGIGKNPESFAVYGPAKYFIDVNRAVVLRLSNDGLTAISDTGLMHNYFTDRCNAILNSGQRPNVTGVYDIKFNEYILSFQEYIIPGTIHVGPTVVKSETLAWNERFNQWSTFYSYHPEYMNGAGSGIITFSEGRLYVHNVNPIYNKFYGVLYNSEFWVYLNALPSNVKILESISEETNSPWEVYEITTPNGQLTNLIASDFEKKENNEYAAVWRDTNTPNIIPPALPLFEGDVMRDRTMLAKFRYTGNDYNKINAVNFDYILSFLSNR